jgi:hypothetical protein
MYVSKPPLVPSTPLRSLERDPARLGPFRVEFEALASRGKMREIRQEEVDALVQLILDCYREWSEQ